MASERFKVLSFVALILKRGSEVFLIRRFNTGSEDGLYGCAGGGVDAHESVTQAMIREAYEELGIALNKEHLKVVHIVQRKTAQGQEMIGFFFEACAWEGVPCINEPHKCDDAQWFELSNLPHNCQPAFTHVLMQLNQQQFFSEMGW